MDSFLEEGYDYDDNDHNDNNDYGDEDHGDIIICVSDFSAWLPFWRKVYCRLLASYVQDDHDDDDDYGNEKCG